MTKKIFFLTYKTCLKEIYHLKLYRKQNKKYFCQSNTVPFSINTDSYVKQTTYNWREKILIEKRERKERKNNLRVINAKHQNPSQSINQSCEGINGCG